MQCPPSQLGGDSIADGANIVLRTGTVTSGMKWKIEKGSQGYKIVSYSDPTMVLCTSTASATAGSNLKLSDFEGGNDSYQDEWEIRDVVYAFSIGGKTSKWEIDSMKQNKIYIYLLIGVLIISFVSCGTARKQNANVDASSGSIDEDKAEDTNSAESYVYGFNTYSDCWKALADGDATDYKTLRSESSQYGALYEAMLSKFASENALLYIPASQGKELPLQNREGFSNISLLTSELYGMPWIWYNCVYDDTKISIRVTYPSILNNKEVSEAKTAGEILKVIAPNAPLPDNYQSYESYRNVYEQLLSIGGESVSALVQECTDGSAYVSFLLKDIYVTVCTQDVGLPDEIWNEFSMVVYTAE